MEHKALPSMDFRPLRRATKGAAFGNRNFFVKKLSKNFYNLSISHINPRHVQHGHGAENVLLNFF
ncbi:MAG TPA: hypothetical protein IAA83_03410 [Candidatus Avoscillospira avistercoris]|uniref:Uncharacterized protein n=1 Tax=Candidatus Avoscillospira avistercoris TaxID=2840707 RepID=A0A9D1JTP7_9FIRM|nr:hypothetical protein [Candidatus Avoscillospira avistercoris]